MPPLLALTIALLGPPARAQDAVSLDPPLPVQASPWPVRATAWLLPHADAAWLEEGDAERRCPVEVQVAPDGSVSAQAPDCPAAMQADALAATAAWRFQPVKPTDQPTTLGLTYIVRFSKTIGAMTLHAEFDPGAQAAEDGLEGPTGLRLVHEASPAQPLVRPLPRKVRKAGQAATACTLRVRVEISGKPSEALIQDCPDALSPDALKTTLRARYEPTRVDGSPQSDVVDVSVRYR